MKKYIPLAVIAAAALIALFSVVGEGGLGHMWQLEQSVDRQRSENRVAHKRVRDLKKFVRDLQLDDREFEKAARGRLGVARPDELVFFFEEGEAVPLEGDMPLEGGLEGGEAE